MSNESGQSKQEQPQKQKQAPKWGDVISRERQTELRRCLDRWQAESDHQARRGPFDRQPRADFAVTLTGADVSWLALLRDPDARGGDASLNLDGADLGGAHLERAFLTGVHLGYANLGGAHLEHANLVEAHLEGASLWQAYLEHATFSEAHLDGASLGNAHLEHVSLTRAHLEHADLRWANLRYANLSGAHLEDANLVEAHLEHANLSGAHLEDANLVEAHLEGVDLRGADMVGTHLTGAWFDKASRLNDANLASASLDQVNFDQTNLTVVNWSQVTELGDEQTARMHNTKDGKIKDQATRLGEYKSAVRANRLLSVALRNQGMNEDADRFAYRAQFLQQRVLLQQSKLFGYAFFGFLHILAGCGYKPGRAVGWYLATIAGFAITYYLIGHASGVIPGPVDAVVFSLTSFHGRGFFPSEKVSLHSPIIVLAALEAVIGLLIEISFIATFTQRFFGR